MPNNVINIAEEVIDISVTEQYVVVNAMNGPGPTGPAGAGGLVNPMTSVGDMIYGGSTGTPTRLIGNTTTTKKYLTQTGDGTNSIAPVWEPLSVFTSTTAGIVSASGGGTTNFLRADGTWAAPIGSVTSVGVSVSSTVDTDITVSGSPVTGSGTININIPNASNSARGVVTTGTQSFNGAKTFANNITINDGTVSNVIGYATIGGSGAGIVGTSTNHALAIRTNGTNAVFVHTDQNVSIGSTSNNGYKLDVVGVIRGQSGVAVYNTVSGYGARITIEAVGGSETLKIAKDGSLSGPTQYHFYYSDGTSAFQIKSGTSLIQDDTWETLYVSGSSTRRHFSVGSGYSFSFFDAGASRFGAIGSAKTDNNASALILRYRTGGVDTEGIRLTTTGQLKLANYTSTSSFTGTAAGYLAFDSSGNIITTAGSGGGGGTPAGSTGQVQFNNAGAFGADANFVWDNTAKAFGVGAATVNSKAVMELTSTTKGFLPPRMTSTQRAAITTPAEGLVVFQTDTVSASNAQGLWIYVNATWRALTMR